MDFDYNNLKDHPHILNLIINLGSETTKGTILYKENHVYDIQSILGLLDEYGYNHDNIIFQAMEEMISNRYTVTDAQGQIGYIINKGS